MRMRLMFACAAVVALAGCGDTKLWAGKSVPDETSVIDGPTLAVPPDFDLHPPSKGEDYEAVLRTQKTLEAKTLITGVSGTVAPVSGTAGDDQWLMKQAGMADENIRQQLEADEAKEQAQPKPSFWQKLTGKAGK